jgi:hypothetical protein
MYDDTSMKGRATESVAVVFGEPSMKGRAEAGMAAEVYVDSTSAAAPLLAGHFAGAVMMMYVDFMARFATADPFLDLAVPTLHCLFGRGLTT